MVELIHKIYSVFSNIHNVSCRLSDVIGRDVVFDIYVKSDQETALNEYDDLIEWMLYNTMAAEISKVIILVHRI